MAVSPDTLPGPVIAPEETLTVAMMLSSAGGFLDAFTWLGHGGVFANAQTGNVVLLGVFAALGRWPEALRHIPPIIAFVCGIFVAHRLRVHETRAGARRVALYSLVGETVLLCAVAALPAPFPDFPIVLGIAFVASLQSSSFARVHGWAYSSVMTTGNLRRMTEALFMGLTAPGDPASLAQGRVFACICTSFAIGSAAGALATERLANRALVVPILLLLLALARSLGLGESGAAKRGADAPS